MVSSGAQNSHQGLLPVGFPNKDSEIDFSLQEIIKECFWNQYCGSKGKEAALGRGMASHHEGQRATSADPQ